MMRFRKRTAAMRNVIAWLAVMLVCGAGPGARAAARPAEMILVNGKIVTLNPRVLMVQAVAIEQGRFVAVGTNEQIRAYAGPGTRVVDLRGRTVIPGLIDSHIHAIRQGLTWDEELHWQTATSLRQGLQMIRDRVARTPAGTWIVVAGGWHESQFTENRKPTPADLDAISSDHPIWVQYLYSEAMMNKAAMKAVGLTAETKDPFTGKVLKEASGQPTGTVTGFGGINAFYVKIPRPPLEGQIASTRNWFRELNGLALTDVGDVAGGGLLWPGDYQAVSALHDRGELTLRLHW